MFPVVALLLFGLFAGCDKDDDNDDDNAIRPSVSTTGPVNNATDVFLNKTITATFNESMDPISISSTTFTLFQEGTPVTGTVSYSGLIASFDPTVDLLPNTIYTITITNEVENLFGKSMENDYIWEFTTGTIISAPTVISTDPENNAINVARNKVVKVNFSEAINSSTIDGTTFYLKKDETLVVGTITYSGTTATVTPTNLWDSETIYTATITSGIENLDGIAIESNIEWSFTAGTETASLEPVFLGTAGNYVILAKTAINNISTSAITGDLGLSPAATSYITGFSLTNATGYATSAQVTGHIFAADMADPTPINLTTAVENMITAYNDAAGRPFPDFLELATGSIGGLTLTPGLYKWTNTVSIGSDITISGGADDVWIFQISEDLLMSNGVNITLVGGAQAKNIFWQLAGQATLGTTSHFEGIILSMTGINFQTGASFNGRALAQTAVVLDGNIIVEK